MTIAAAPDRLFIDTNILVYASWPAAPLHQQALTLDCGDPAALGLAEPILPLLDQELAIEAPFRVYLSCHRALAAAHDPRADAILHRARRLAADTAASIDDGQTRDRFLSRVPAPFRS